MFRYFFGLLRLMWLIIQAAAAVATIYAMLPEWLCDWTVHAWHSIPLFCQAMFGY
jgi:hypothetical protein